MYEIRTLEGVSTEELHRAFAAAFSDYTVKVDLSLEKFTLMLIKNGFDAACSLGAFNKNELAGFVINGVREWDGILTAYDSGTGVIPSCRKAGITTAMFDKLMGILSEKLISRYLLEVIKTNIPAFNLYRKLGFRITREFLCFRAEKSELDFTSEKKFTVSKQQSGDWNRLKSFWDNQPSWQNSLESVTALPCESVIVTAESEGRIAGYGVIGKKSASIYQLAVDRAFRNKGIGSEILRSLINETGASSITCVNVDSRSQSAAGFLTKAGFKVFAEQYEMVKAVG
ncbi:MAG: ribosomal-protein-alanine N-acetyltransferase [Firmicutes bacterium ADurb.Bin182]|nr:MAG: ribosomal-protein-alanine N-acetyltransferase [Firmicutes bacterium ADurb.Bin182]